MSFTITSLDCGLLVEGITNLDLAQTLDCGQCFTFSQLPVSDCIPNLNQTWQGWAGNHPLTISSRKDGALLFHDTTQELFLSFWKNYFDLDTDYGKIKSLLSQDETLAKAITFAPGIRILRQDGWEALCCFIISQNNNIKRIKGIVQRLCEGFGEPIGEGCFSFPSPQILAKCTVEDLAPLRSGFRAKYLIDAAKKVHSKEVNLDKIPSMSLSDAKAELIKILGVGPKVADCALLYGFYRLECCPMDVWMKRVFAVLYPKGLPECAKDHIGIAQQYLFHYARTCLNLKDEEPLKKKASPKKKASSNKEAHSA